MKSYEFTKGDYTIKIFAWNEFAAKRIWIHLQFRNYYPTSRKVRQISSDGRGYEVMV